jgi:hypothetical protein
MSDACLPSPAGVFDGLNGGLSVSFTGPASLAGHCCPEAVEVPLFWGDELPCCPTAA